MKLLLCTCLIDLAIYSLDTLSTYVPVLRHAHTHTHALLYTLPRLLQLALATAAFSYIFTLLTLLYTYVYQIYMRVINQFPSICVLYIYSLILYFGYVTTHQSSTNTSSRIPTAFSHILLMSRPATGSRINNSLILSKLADNNCTEFKIYQRYVCIINPIFAVVMVVLREIIHHRNRTRHYPGISLKVPVF